MANPVPGYGGHSAVSTVAMFVILKMAPQVRPAIPDGHGDYFLISETSVSTDEKPMAMFSAMVLFTY